MTPPAPVDLAEMARELGRSVINALVDNGWPIYYRAVISAQIERLGTRALESAHLAGQRSQWTCFHCGEMFTSVDCARAHFGATELEQPACKLNEQEGGLALALRKAEDELARYRNEDSDAARRYYAQQSDHATALHREEEKGYARGLKDGRALVPSLPAPGSPTPAPERSQWQPIETMPPHHTKLLFLCSNGNIYQGAPCYGMHAPWWVTDTSLGKGAVLNDTMTVTHWMPSLPAPEQSK